MLSNDPLSFLSIQDSALLMTSILAAVGSSTIRSLEYIGGLSRLVTRSLYWTIVAPLRGKGLRWRSSVEQMVIVGFNALPIVMAIAGFIGVIMALQGAHELRRFGAVSYVSELVGISITRELAPLLTAIIVIGRSGSAFAAEIGTMKVAEEIDALTTMGLNPTKFLVVPKLVAMMVMVPCLTVVADIMGILGGAAIAVASLGQQFSIYMQSSIDALDRADLITGLVKSVVFALIITKIGCYEGFSVEGGAEGVGRATTKSVVTSIFLIIAADMIFTAIFYFARL